MIPLFLLACTTPDDPKDSETVDDTATDSGTDSGTDSADTSTDTADTDTIDTGETDVDDTSDTSETDTTADSGDTSTDTSDTGDTTTDTAEPTCDTSAALECDAPAPCGYPVEQMILGGTAPTSTGGTLNPGAYVITSYSSYDPSHDSAWSRSTGTELDYLMIFDDDGTVRLTASVSMGGTAATQSAAGTWSTADGVLSISLTCPEGPDAEPVPYTATTDTLDFGNNDVYITAIRVGDP